MKQIENLNARLEMNFIKGETHEFCLSKLPYSKFSYKVNIELKQMEDILDDLLANPSMSVEKKVEKILFLKDKCRFVYDEMRIEYKKYSWEIFKRFKEIKKSIDYLATEYLKKLPECNFILATDSVIIKNEETKEIPTTITGVDDDIANDLLFYGFFASEGFLEPSCEFDLNTGIHIYAHNSIAKTVKDSSESISHLFSDADSTRYLNSGIYLIEKGQNLGIHLIKTNRK